MLVKAIDSLCVLSVSYLLLLFYLIELQCNVIHSHRLTLCSDSAIFGFVFHFTMSYPTRSSPLFYNTSIKYNYVTKNKFIIYKVQDFIDNCCIVVIADEYHVFYIMSEYIMLNTTGNRYILYMVLQYLVLKEFVSLMEACDN